MILSAIAEKLKRRSKDDFKGRHFEASLILQVVSWYLRYPLSYRDIEEMLLDTLLHGSAGWRWEPDGVGRRPLPKRSGPCRAIQSQGGLPPPYSETATSDHQLGGL